MAETNLFKSDICQGYFGTKRFDRMVEKMFRIMCINVFAHNRGLNIAKDIEDCVKSRLKEYL